MAQAMLLRRGSAAAPYPEFTYTGTYTFIDDGDGNWRIKCLTSGTLRFSNTVGSIDAFLVGGGGGAPYVGGGGGGGYTETDTLIAVAKNLDYTITIGAGGTATNAIGGARAGTGGTTSAFGHSIIGGKGGAHIDNSKDGGDGGSGGGGTDTGYGGTDGSNGTGTTPGTGQGTTTREFGEASGTLYSSGGRGWVYTGSTGAANTGNGAGAGNSNGRVGGSGIVVIRNHREAA